MKRGAALLGLLVTAHAQDFQVWNEVDLTGSWRKVDFLVPLLARTAPGSPNPQLAATGITADVPLPWRLTITGGYLFADLPQRSDFVHIPLVALTRSFRIGRVEIADRNRFEKLIGYANSPVRYRNRIAVDRPFNASAGWHVFADDEIFFNLSTPGWNQNRARAGAGKRLNHKLFLDVYFLQRNAGGVSPARVIGTTLKVAFAPR